jgi:[ribosomal protein S5]-alanine N-acetyltransferase
MFSLIQTERLRLIPATVALCDAEAEGAAAVGRLLGATMPASWPPAVFERDDVDRVRRALLSSDEAQTWTLHYMLRRAESLAEPPTLIGVAGFAGWPRPAGIVEIGYAVAEEYRRLGYATEAVVALLDRAFSDARVRVVAASTYVTIPASIRVLEKTGFALVSRRDDTGLMQFQCTRTDYERRPGGTRARPIAVLDAAESANRRHSRRIGIEPSDGRRRTGPGKP